MGGLKKDIDMVCKMEYERGYSDGSLSVRAEVNEAEYKRGLEDAWKEAKKIFDGTHDVDDLDKIFVCGYDLGEIITGNTVQEVKAKIEAYEAQKKEEIGYTKGYNQALEEYKEQILYHVSLSDSQRTVMEQVCDRLKK